MDIQEVLSQAFGCSKALIWVFSLNVVFPHASVEIRGKVKERKTGEWNHRKGRTDGKREKKEKLAQLVTESLRD